MIAELECVVLDCPHPRALAEFYQALLGGEVNKPDRRWGTSDSFATLHTASARQRFLNHPANGTSGERDGTQPQSTRFPHVRWNGTDVKIPERRISRLRRG